MVSFKNRPTSKLLKVTLLLKFSFESIDAIRLTSPKLLIILAVDSKDFSTPLKAISILIFSGISMLSGRYEPANLTKSFLPEMILRLGKS